MPRKSNKVSKKVAEELSNSRDRFSPEARSLLMSKIRSKNTKFERDFICVLKKVTKKRFVTHQRNIRGNPDIVFMKDKVCVFIDSDFWHGWMYPKWKDSLKSEFWRKKIERNRERDRRNTAYLRRNGWKVKRIWEHSIKKDLDETLARLLQLLS